MLLLRIFLYLICFVTLSWIALVFTGPFIIKSLISSYSDNQVIASNVTISPKLDVKIGRIDYAIKNLDDQTYTRGFSRAVNLIWSIFDEKPFIEIQIGPTKFDDILLVDNLIFNTPSFSSINFEEVLLKADFTNMQSGANLVFERLNLQGIYKPKKEIFSEILIESPEIILNSFEPLFLKRLTLGILELDISESLRKQTILSEISAEEVSSQWQDIRLANLNGTLRMEKGEVDFKLISKDFGMLDLENPFSEISVDGLYSIKDFLKEARIALSNSSTSNIAGNQPNVFIDISKIEDGRFDLKIIGELSSFVLDFSNNYIGRWPESNIELGMRVDLARSLVDVISQINLNNEIIPEITGGGQVMVELDKQANLLNCIQTGCEILDFVSYYKFNFDEDWISASSKCSSNRCDLVTLTHTFRTSDTDAIFSKITQSQTLNPIYSLFLFGAVNAGKKIGNGHEVVINY